jgi:hypothetical protein
MNDTQKPFMDYWLEVDAALFEFFGIDSSSAGMDEKEIAMAQEAGCSPEEFAHWHGDRYDLTYLDDWKAIYRLGHQGTAARKIATLNDLCRKAMGIAGRVVQTAGICALPSAQQSAIRESRNVQGLFAGQRPARRTRLRGVRVRRRAYLLED